MSEIPNWVLGLMLVALIGLVVVFLKMRKKNDD